MVLGGPEGGDCEEYHLLGCDAANLVEIYRRRFRGSKLLQILHAVGGGSWVD